MDCIGCGAPDTRIKDTMDSGIEARRHRTCAACGGYFFSNESADSRTYRGPARSNSSQEKPKSTQDKRRPTQDRAISRDERPPPGEDPPLRPGNSDGGLGGDPSGAGSGAGPETDTTVGSGPDPWKKNKEIWAPAEWNRKFGMVWTNKYQRFYGDAGDGKACANLAALIERFPVEEILAAQDEAPQMFQAYLASDDPVVVKEKHPFVFFVTRFSRLRATKGEDAGGRKLPDYG